MQLNISLETPGKRQCLLIFWILVAKKEGVFKRGSRTKRYFFIRSLLQCPQGIYPSKRRCKEMKK